MKNFRFSTFNSHSAQRGFALLVSIIFMSVMLAFGLVLGSFSYKQQTLASSAIDSQYAFYAADAALECALYADQIQNLYAYNSDPLASAPGMVCENLGPISAAKLSHSGTQWVIFNRMQLDSNSRCADVTVYKPLSGTTYIFSLGYSVPCSTVSSPGSARFSSRGLQAYY